MHIWYIVLVVKVFRPWKNAGKEGTGRIEASPPQGVATFPYTPHALETTEWKQWRGSREVYEMETSMGR
jgi:hypothetical protein